ncbi:ABC transporter [Rhodanobacter sp. B04]|uniref:ABC transporter ATP-binding protein n=1 Tax=Rhodanobacter sp. B04 TaxID=1945860 RepID=UPI0009851BD1|nr:ATP-binding cassette domain-containing protein [Rhodanobacter sp. B04]OOG65607.1 ABC transporter [Rhodanobacter sp. B04]
MPSPSVSVESVTKRFSGHTAVNRLSLQVSAGGIFGLLGPNGAGKSTTIRLIMGILEPDEGSVSLFGSAHGSRKLSARIGYLPEERGLYKKMKVLDHLIFLGETKGISRADARRRALAWLERLGIGEWALKKVEDLSKGMQQKVQFAGALLHEPELVILDEPFSGLDPVNAQVMKDIVVEIAASGRTVLFSTHVMEQAERMCDRIAIIARGQTVVSGTVAQVKADFGGRHVALGFSHDKSRAEAILADRSLIARVDDYGASAELQMVDGADPGQLLAALVHAGVGLRRFEVVEPSLHAIFIARVGADAAVAHAGAAA